jgi:hypothetical protein
MRFEVWRAERCIFPLKKKMDAFLYYTISPFQKRFMISNGNNYLASALPLTHKDLSLIVQR